MIIAGKNAHIISRVGCLPMVGIRAVSEAIESAREVIFIEDWWLVID
jgi:hypothetical protein